MIQLFELLARPIEFCYRLVPKVEMLHSYERGVRYKRGKEPQVVGPGVRWYWPITTTLNEISVARRTARVQGFRLTTRCHKTVVASAVLVFHVVDVVTWDSLNDDSSEGVVEVLEAAVRRVIMANTLEELQDPGEKGAQLTPADKALGARARKELEETFGVKVEKCRLGDMAPARVLALDHTGMPDAADLEE